jgi:phosphatidate cytidylyltransferase
MILPRILTAIIGIPLVILSIKFGSIPYFVFILAITCLALNEYFYLTKQAEYETYPVVGFIIGVLFVLSIYFNGPRITTLDMESQLTSIVLSFCIFLLLLIEIIRNAPYGSISRLGITLFALFIISWPFGHMLLIRDLRPNGEKFTYFLFFLIWLVDTGAYAAGSKWGKHKLADKISPKKSVEGVIGALVTSVISSIILWKVLGLTMFSLTEIVVVGLVLTGLCVISDLAESLIKRDSNLKDSDSLLPGHGGILDRFDSFIFTAPLFYYYLVILHK